MEIKVEFTAETEIVPAVMALALRDLALEIEETISGLGNGTIAFAYGDLDCGHYYGFLQRLPPEPECALQRAPGTVKRGKQNV